MLPEFIKAWDKHQSSLRDAIKAEGRNIFSYRGLLETTLKHCFPDQAHAEPDSSKIYTIDDGEYQGTLLFLVPQKVYQPRKYYYFFVSYGSCSGCDTMQSIHYDSPAEDDGSPSKKQIDLLWTEALHMMQNAKEI